MTQSAIGPRAIQRALNMLGANLTIDGEIGPLTRSAIKDVVQRATEVSAHWPEDRLLIAFEQIMLADAGLYPRDRVDGKAGPLTMQALEMWREPIVGGTPPGDGAAVAPVSMIERAYFFNRIRHSLFGGTLRQAQVDAIERYLDYRDAKWPDMSDAALAYLLATVKHETAHEMVPIEERGGETYLRSKPYYPWYGRGPIQLTWETNYRKFGITDPDDALKWPAALDIAFRGMMLGMFTGKKLADYISGSRRDYVGARRIINGTDKARLIAGYAEAFLDALTQSRERPAA
ncbi:MAG TPA: hypothetical protein VIG36_05055 [Methylocystis sp.]|jgi:hypothetical protein